MIDFKKQIGDILRTYVLGLTPDEINNMIEIPGDSKMGDYAFPCFRLAKELKKSPQIIASEIANMLEKEELFEKIESVNAYVNMFVSKPFYMEKVLSLVFAQKEKFGSSDVGKNRKVLVEFSSPNIAKPFHIGHIRSTVIGNAIYKIYNFLGYDTERINHLGDYGTQFGKMIVAYNNWGNKEAIEKEPIKALNEIYVKFHEEAENDPTLEDQARETFKKLEEGSKNEVALWQWFRDVSLKEFSRVYAMLDIEFDSYAGESFYSDKMQSAIVIMESKGLLLKSEGAEIVDLEQFNMPPALIRKKDGSTLYITRDVAAAIYRKEHYDFYKNLYIVASQQNLHFAQWKKVLSLMGYAWEEDCVHIPFGLVSLEDGVMSTRKGRVVYLEDVLNKAIEQTKEIVLEKKVSSDIVDEISKQIGIGAVIFQELSNGKIKDYVFSWDKVLNFEGETGPYVQYTHARACSVLRNAKIDVSEAIDYKYLNSDSAYELCKLIYGFSDAVLEAAQKYEPSIVTRHVVDIAQGFNRFYHNEHILVEKEEEKKAKLLLVFAAKTAIKNGLGLLGIHAPERM